jgi:hypothetical protein
MLPPAWWMMQGIGSEREREPCRYQLHELATHLFQWPWPKTRALSTRATPSQPRRRRRGRVRTAMKADQEYTTSSIPLLRVMKYSLAISRSTTTPNLLMYVVIGSVYTGRPVSGSSSLLGIHRRLRGLYVLREPGEPKCRSSRSRDCRSRTLVSRRPVHGRRWCRSVRRWSRRRLATRRLLDKKNNDLLLLYTASRQGAATHTTVTTTTTTTATIAIAAAAAAAALPPTVFVTQQRSTQHTHGSFSRTEGDDDHHHWLEPVVSERSHQSHTHSECESFLVAKLAFFFLETTSTTW